MRMVRAAGLGGWIAVVAVGCASSKTAGNTAVGQSGGADGGQNPATGDTGTATDTGATGGAGGSLGPGDAASDTGGPVGLGGAGGPMSGVGGAITGSGGSGGAAVGGIGGAVVGGVGGAPAGVGGAIAGSGGTPGTGGAPVPVAQPDLTAPAVDLQGGSSPSAGSQGKSGGTIHLISRGAISIDPQAPHPSIATPAVPAGAIALTSAALAANATVNGAATIDGTVLSAGTDPVRAIVVGGDLFVRGTLRSADLGAARQGLSLQVGGTLYLDGAIDTGGADGNGQSAGPLTIAAQRVAVNGQIVATGGDGTTSGGRGGDLRLTVGGDILLGGMISVRGGAAVATGAAAAGGDAGTVGIECDSTVTLAGILDGRGGVAVAAAAGGTVAGGAAGAVRVGETAAPTSIAILTPVRLTGGFGAASGGAGGLAQLEPREGNLTVATVLDASGGDSDALPGNGGLINGYPGPGTVDNVSTAALVVAGTVMVNGGSVMPGGAGAGAAGGVIKMVMRSTNGNTTVTSTGTMQSNGGRAGGANVAGGGGLIYIFSQDGKASMAGRLIARGGDASDAGGTGGGGGFVYIFTDDNHSVFTGDVPSDHVGALVIESSGFIDASGGDGNTSGGDARHDDVPGDVGGFPFSESDEFDVRDMAVLINSDGVHGPTTGWIQNLGKIVARGGHPNGNGGDLAFHGSAPTGIYDSPILGDIDVSGSGTGLPGFGKPE
ncbi:MAG TPA: hypothetical protein VFH68_03160 [Polyangia bacterium]|nr:hypothetical protein [Polyangia bacterium]